MNTHSRWFAGVMLIMWASLAQADFHLFRLDQLYSNSDGSIQFVVLRETTGSNGEHLWAGHSLRATPTGGTAKVLPFTTNLPSSATANRRVLVATPGFAALGIVTPDYTMPANFLPINGGTVNYAEGTHQITYAALPTDGTNALSSNGAVIPNVATNFFGQTGSVVPAAAIPTATAVEFYHAGLDHYFITDRAQEISDLDTGVHTGWTRTTLSFNVFTAPGPGTSPVCRFRIPPESGDSHFYGRGTKECDDTAAKFPTFFNEDPQFFHVILPVLGVCPPGTINVYRAFSNRPGDANHRYTIDPAVRDLMAAMQPHPWTIEGDGDNFVVMCVPPTPSAVAPPNPPPMPPPPMPPEPPEPPGYPYP